MELNKALDVADVPELVAPAAPGESLGEDAACPPSGAVDSGDPVMVEPVSPIAKAAAADPEAASGTLGAETTLDKAWPPMPPRNAGGVATGPDAVGPDTGWVEVVWDGFCAIAWICATAPAPEALWLP